MEEPARIKSQFEDAKLLDDIERFLSRKPSYGNQHSFGCEAVMSSQDV